MATRKLGKAGHGVFAGNTIHVTQHTYTGANDKQEVTTTGSDGSTEYIPGYNDRTGSLEGFIDFGGAPVETDLLMEGEQGTLTLKYADSAKQVTGSAIIDNVVYTNAAKSVVSFTANFQFTGAVTRS